MLAATMTESPHWYTSCDVDKLELANIVAIVLIDIHSIAQATGCHLLV